VRDTEIKKAGFQAEIDSANQQSQQQGPLSQATAKQAVVQEETKVAELQAQQKEQQLQVDVRKPADAEAYRQTPLATAAREAAIRHAEAEASQLRLRAEAQAAATKIQAEAQAAATRLNGQAEADAIRAKGLAEAEAIKARMEAEAAGIERRAAALSQNQEAVIAQQIAEQLPEVVRAAASPFEHVDSFTVLNGAEGVTAALGSVIKQAGVLTTLARQTLLPSSSNGHDSNGTDAHAPGSNGTSPTAVREKKPAATTEASVAAPEPPVPAVRPSANGKR
jgi:uncharacterized membrane protein YqiK